MNVSHPNLIWFAFLSVIPTASIANDLCNVEVVKALKQEYKISDKNDIVDITEQLACSKRNGEMDIEYENFSFGKKDLEEACSKNNRKFFERNYKDLSFSFVPADSFAKLVDVCSDKKQNGPSQFGLSLDVLSDTVSDISLKATWFAPGTNVSSVVVSSFDAKGPVKCPKNHPLSPGKTITNGGVSLICNRTGDGNIVFAVNTRNGVGQLVSSENKRPSKFYLSLNGVDDSMKCYINNTFVLGQSYGESSKKIEITNSVLPGVNVLRCDVADLVPAATSAACWGYNFSLIKDQSVINNPSFYCCDTSSTCMKRGESISVPFTK